MATGFTPLAFLVFLSLEFQSSQSGIVSWVSPSPGRFANAHRRPRPPPRAPPGAGPGGGTMALGQTKTVVGLDIGSYAVKAVALAGNRDRITLQGYAQARIDNQDPGEVIRKVIDQLGIKPKRLV